jgi:hypothetical protein
VVVIALACVAAPAPAAAHLRSGTVAVDYKASVLNPDTPAYTAQIFQSDRALSLKIKPGHTVEVIGYLGEPVFRLAPAGLWVNAASPTAVVFKLLGKSERVLATAPRWRLEPGRKSVIWQDSRAQGLPPGVSVGTFRVPLLVDGRRTALAGVLQHFPAPSLVPWVLALAALLLAGVGFVMVRNGRLAGRAAIGFALAGALASLVIVVAFVFDAYASVGTWIEGFDLLAFLGVGLWVLLRGPERWHMAAAVGLGLVALGVGLIDGAVFFHPIVLAVLPASVVRVFVVLAIGAGSDAAALGCLEML